jgi:CDP-diacylglycerol--serine O-phosphatidyltransferase
VFFIALLIGYPWYILSACTVLYLLSLPAGWKSYRDQERNAAAQAVPPVDITAPEPASPFVPAPPEQGVDSRLARLN